MLSERTEEISELKQAGGSQTKRKPTNQDQEEGRASGAVSEQCRAIALFIALPSLVHACCLRARSCCMGKKLSQLSAPASVSQHVQQFLNLLAKLGTWCVVLTAGHPLLVVLYSRQGMILLLLPSQSALCAVLAPCCAAPCCVMLSCAMPCHAVPRCAAAGWMRSPPWSSPCAMGTQPTAPGMDGWCSRRGSCWSTACLRQCIQSSLSSSPTSQVPAHG